MKKNLLLSSKFMMFFLPAVLVLCALDALSQARLLKDINPEEDVYGNEFSSLTAGSDKVYFIANQNELWKTTRQRRRYGQDPTIQGDQQPYPYGKNVVFHR